MTTTPLRKSGRGRPPAPAETVRCHRVVTYVTSAELRALRRVADRRDKSLSSIVHRFLVSALEDQEHE
jgi:hypothetical protein